MDGVFDQQVIIVKPWSKSKSKSKVQTGKKVLIVKVSQNDPLDTSKIDQVDSKIEDQ